jgi:hypothetical protein
VYDFARDWCVTTPVIQVLPSWMALTINRIAPGVDNAHMKSQARVDKLKRREPIQLMMIAPGPDLYEMVTGLG